MFPQNLEKLNAVTDILDFGFDKDPFYSDKDILKKGYIKELIEESDDVVTITKEFVSFDGTYRRTDIKSISKDSFDLVRGAQLSKDDVKKEIDRLTAEIKVNSNKELFEACKELKEKKDNLEKLLTM